VGNQAGSSDHVGSHAITNEQEHVLGAANLGEVADQPVCSGVGAIVAQDRLILARLVQSDTSVRLRGNIDDRGLEGIAGEQILVPGEVPGSRAYLALVTLTSVCMATHSSAGSSTPKN